MLQLAENKKLTVCLKCFVELVYKHNIECEFRRPRPSPKLKTVIDQAMLQPKEHFLISQKSFFNFVFVLVGHNEKIHVCCMRNYIAISVPALKLKIHDLRIIM